jgi:hypothetical protein
MKTFRIIQKTALLFLLAGLLFPVNSCKKPVNPIENLKLIIDYNIIKTTIDIHLVDAATGQMLGSAASQDAFIRFAGEDELAVVDVLGVRPTGNKFGVSRGIATMALVPGDPYEPSTSNPVNFNIIANVPGYLTTTKEVFITETGRNFVAISVMPLDNPPSGVYVRQEPDAATAQVGRVIVPTTVEVPGGSASVTIPEGIMIRDAGGNPLSGGLNVTIVRFDNTDPEALESFPGGLTPTVNRLDGSTQSGTFYSAGFVAIEITDGSGNTASQFEDGTIQLISQVSPETYNPFTQTTIAAGDEIPYWSLDENTGVWTEEGVAVTQLVDGNLQFQVELTHLSFYNFDWLIGVLCPSGSPFRFLANAILPGPFLIKGKVYRQDDNSFINTILMWVENDQPLYTTYAPADLPVYIEWDTEGSAFMSIDPASQPTYVNNLCSNETVNVNLLVNQDPNLKTITISVSLFCPTEPVTTIKPTFTAYYILKDSGNSPIAIEMIQGVASIPGLVLGQTYYVWITYDNTEYGTDVLITQETYTYLDYEIPAEICDEVMGAVGSLQ